MEQSTVFQPEVVNVMPGAAAPVNEPPREFQPQPPRVVVQAAPSPGETDPTQELLNELSTSEDIYTMSVYRRAGINRDGRIAPKTFCGTLPFSAAWQEDIQNALRAGTYDVQVKRNTKVCLHLQITCDDPPFDDEPEPEPLPVAPVAVAPAAAPPDAPASDIDQLVALSEKMQRIAPLFQQRQRETKTNGIDELIASVEQLERVKKLFPEAAAAPTGSTFADLIGKVFDKLPQLFGTFAQLSAQNSAAAAAAQNFAQYQPPPAQLMNSTAAPLPVVTPAPASEFTPAPVALDAPPGAPPPPGDEPPPAVELTEEEANAEDVQNFFEDLLDDLKHDRPVQQAAAALREFKREFADIAPMLDQVINGSVDEVIGALLMIMPAAAPVLMLPHARKWIADLQGVLKS